MVVNPQTRSLLRSALPFTKAQARRILNVKGEPFIDPDRLPHLGMRLTETYLRRKLYALEDRIVTEQWRTFDAAHADIRAYGLRAADSVRLDTLGRDYASLHWQQQVMGYARQRLQTATTLTSQSAFKASLTAWYANYYGKAWQLDVNTRPEVRVNVPTPSQIAAHRAILMPDVREAVEPNRSLFDLMGGEWQQRFTDELAEMLVKVRRGLDRSTNEQQSITQALRGVRDSIGLAATLDDGFTAHFYRMQTLTRTAIMDGAQDGAEALWLANSDPEKRDRRGNDAIGVILLSLTRWVTAHDERVCVICRGLDGQVSSLFDFGRNRPPAHANCRCQEIPVIIEALLMPDDVLPYDTFPDWLAGFGAGLILDDFLGVGLESRVI